MNGDPDHQDVYVSPPTQPTQQPVAPVPQPAQNQPVYTPLNTTPPPTPQQIQAVPTVDTPPQQPTAQTNIPITPSSSFAPTETPVPEAPALAQAESEPQEDMQTTARHYTDPNEAISVPDRTPSLREMRKNKQRTTLGIVVSVAGIILLAALGVYLDRRAANPLPADSTPQTTQETTAATNDELIRNEVVELVEGVISITENTHYELALQYFLYGDGERLREDDIIDSLEFIEGTYKRSDDTFNILTSTDRTRLMDHNAQVLVDFVGNDIYPVRFDLEKRNDEWKITFITFGGKLNL